MRDRVWEYLRTHFTRADAARLVSSLILATMLWGYVSLITDPEETQSFAGLELAPLDDLEDDLILTSAPPDITVRLTGPESVIEDISPTEITVRLDLEDLDGPVDFYQARVRIEAPDGVRRAVADPSFVRIAVAQLAEPVDFALEPEFVGLLENTPLQADTPQAEVSTVRVSGAIAVVERVARVILPVEIGNRTQSFTDSFVPVALDAAENPIPEAIIDPATVSADVSIVTRGHSAPVLIRISGAPAIGYDVREQRTLPQSVLLDGPEEALRSIFYVNTLPLDITGETETVAESVAIDIASLPDGVTILQPTSGQVQAIVQISPQSSPPQSLPGQLVQVVGLDAGLTAVSGPPEIAVVVETSTEQIEQLELGDIIVSVDATGLTAGTYQLSPSVSVPSEMSWIRTDPEVVTITITESDPFNGDAVPGLGGIESTDDPAVSPEASPVESPTP